MVEYIKDEAIGDTSARAELAELMRLMGERMRHRFHSVVADHGLTPPLFGMLGELDDPSPMSAVADRMSCDASYVTSLADRLETLGLIERRRDPSDRRVRQLALTDDGIQLRGRIGAAMSKTHGLFDQLDDEDVSDLIRIYRKLLADDPAP
jgi:DNA-binding MarR family transcriptional regulator